MWWILVQATHREKRSEAIMMLFAVSILAGKEHERRDDVRCCRIVCMIFIRKNVTPLKRCSQIGRKVAPAKSFKPFRLDGQKA